MSECKQDCILCHWADQLILTRELMDNQCTPNIYLPAADFEAVTAYSVRQRLYESAICNKYKVVYYVKWRAEVYERLVQVANPCQELPTKPLGLLSHQDADKLEHRHRVLQQQNDSTIFTKVE